MREWTTLFIAKKETKKRARNVLHALTVSKFGPPCLNRAAGPHPCVPENGPPCLAGCIRAGVPCRKSMASPWTGPARHEYETCLTGHAAGVPCRAGPARLTSYTICKEMCLGLKPAENTFGASRRNRSRGRVQSALVCGPTRRPHRAAGPEPITKP
jgi:hypothetical protein